jgi:hypothetical protein
MSIFGNIWDKITGHAQAAAASTSAPTPTDVSAPASFSDVTATASSTAPSQPVDVEAILTDLDSKQSHRSNWRESIVDMMSLLGMDNSLAQRKALATELGYTGDMNDSAKMNIWLHKEVMRQMAANGGKVPASMLD